MTTGKDGYSSLLDPSIKFLAPLKEESAPTIQDVFINWLREWRKGPEYFKNLNEKARKINDDRFKYFNTSIDNRCEITKSIKFYPKT